jgi:virginiamycin B lyase
MWFTENTGSKVGRLSGGAFTEYTLPEPNAQPEGIVTGPDGNLWVAAFGPSNIVQVTPLGAMTVYNVLTFNAGPSRIAIGPGDDGNPALWFTEVNANNIAQITTAGVVSEFAIPTAASGANGIALGPDNDIFFTEHTSNKIGIETGI